MISFLPDIIDSSARERKKYLSILGKVSYEPRKHSVKWFWIAAGTQLQIEKQLNLGFGFPAVIAISPIKKIVATMTSSFTQPNISDFLSNLI